VTVGNDAEGGWLLTRRHCPACKKFIFDLQTGLLLIPNNLQGLQGFQFSVVKRTIRVWPKGTSRTPIPLEVPPGIAEDYREACLVLADSPKASAALSRRCLQNVLRSAGGVKHGDLAKEIDQVIAAKTLPNIIAESLDQVRVIGNFGAHPMKSTTTGEIVDVEPHEAEWNLDVLESLFDFYYVQPARAKAKKDAINKKLVAAGKPPLA
jgi:hypothetical protein